jgi:hypothetical protein
MFFDRTMPKVVWKEGRSGGASSLRLAPHQRRGGTCEFSGRILVYEELPGAVKVEGGQVLYKERRDAGFQDFCRLNEVAAVFDQDGLQIYPDISAEQ